MISNLRHFSFLYAREGERLLAHPQGFKELLLICFGSFNRTLLIVEDDSRRSLAQFKLVAHFLQSRSKRLNLLLLLRSLGLKVFL